MEKETEEAEGGEEPEGALHLEFAVDHVVEGEGGDRGKDSLHTSHYSCCRVHAYFHIVDVVEPAGKHLEAEDEAEDQAEGSHVPLVIDGEPAQEDHN